MLIKYRQATWLAVCLVLLAIVLGLNNPQPVFGENAPIETLSGNYVPVVPVPVAESESDSLQAPLFSAGVCVSAGNAAGSRCIGTVQTSDGAREIVVQGAGENAVLSIYEDGQQIASHNVPGLDLDSISADNLSADGDYMAVLQGNGRMTVVSLTGTTAVITIETGVTDGQTSLKKVDYDLRGGEIFLTVRLSSEQEFGFLVGEFIPAQDLAAAQDFRRTTGADLADNFYINYGGQQEKWFRSQSGDWYYILPTGHVYRWDSKLQSAVRTSADTLVLRLDPSLYTDTGWLESDEVRTMRETAAKFSLYFAGQYHLNWGGMGEKWLKGKDEAGKECWFFLTPNGELRRWKSGTMGGMRKDPVVATLSAAAFEDLSWLFDNAFEVAARQLLVYPNNASFNWGGLQEKWIKGKDSMGKDCWYFLTPAGELRRWDSGTAKGMSKDPVVARLDPARYENLSWLRDPDDLKQAYGFRFGDNDWKNWSGRLDEWWFKGNGDKLYFITPDGTIRQYNNESKANLANAKVVGYRPPQDYWDASWLKPEPSIDGLIKSQNIFVDGYKATTPSNWNPHLPKIVTDGVWSYAIYTRFTPDHAGRTVWIFKKKNDGGDWQYTGRSLKAVHQPPGIVMDKDGNIHISFECSPNSVCSSGGVSAGNDYLNYNLVFGTHNADGSINFSKFSNSKGVAEATSGYMGIGTDPVSGQTYVSILTGGDDHGTQVLFKAGAAAQSAVKIPKLSGQDTTNLYPIIAISPKGEKYVLAGELIPNWVNSAQHRGSSLFRITENGGLEQIFHQRVNDPDGITRCVHGADIAFDQEGRLYLLYNKKPPDQDGNTTFIVSQGSDGKLGSPRGIGNFGSYGQLQIDSRGRLHLLTFQGKDLYLRTSEDGGATWKITMVPIPNLPAGAGSLAWPTVIKPWTSPKGYNPDVMYGLVSIRDQAGYYAVNDFTIDLTRI